MKETEKTQNSRQASTGSNKQLSFLPEPDFNPKLPPINTLPGRALSLMLQGKVISHPDFQDLTCSWRLAAPINKLGNLGWPIERFDVHRSPHKTPIRKYFLAQETIAKFKKLQGGMHGK